MTYRLRCICWRCIAYCDAYDPAQQLGGALYFFLRGMDGPAQGVHVVPPMLELLDALQALINEVQA